MSDPQRPTLVEEQLRGRYSVPLPVIRPIPARALVAGVSAILFGLSLFGFFAEYGRKELVPAIVAPVGGEARVQSIDSASVVRVVAHQGQHVKAGDVLAVVTTDQSSQGMTLSASSVSSLQRQLAAVRGELELSRRDLTLRRSAIQARLSVLQTAVAQAQDEVQTRHELVKRLIQDIEKREPLVAQGAVSASAVDELQLQLSSARAEELGSRRELQSLKSQTLELSAELQTMALREPLLHAQKDKEAAQLEEELSRATAVAQRELTAPVDGVVAGLPISEGQSLNLGQLIAVIVPKDAASELVLQVPSSSLGAVRPGLTVGFRLDAFPYETFGYVEATVRAVDTAATSQSAEGVPLVRAYARITGVPPRVVLQPGMAGVAAVEVERRTVLAWLLWPLLKNFSG